MTIAEFDNENLMDEYLVDENPELEDSLASFSTEDSLSVRTDKPIDEEDNFTEDDYSEEDNI